MARGISGRVVIELEPELKRQLYSILAVQGLTLKEWFIRCSAREIQRHDKDAQRTRKRSARQDQT